jgi:chromosome partitioning protein|tara:strand:+ start:4697 stop:5461 length:765 start_codon:yes stop_codon:yes gene_type:complete
MFLAVICQKGGVGKTTLCVNVSDIYAKNNKKTLIIDLDPQGNSTTYLNKSKETVSFDSEDLFNSHIGFQEKDALFCSENLYLIPSNGGIKKHIEEKLVAGSVLHKRKEKGEFDAFDQIVIDTPPAMNSIIEEALHITDYYLVPTKPEYLAVEGVGQAIEYTKEKVLENKKIKAIFLGVVLNMVDTRRSSYKDFQSELKLLLGDKLFDIAVSYLTEIAESPLHGETISDYSPYGKGKKELTLLVDEIEEKTKRYL